MYSFFNEIRMYSTRTEEIDKHDYYLYLAHQGLTPYLHKIVVRHQIKVPHKATWDDADNLKILTKIIKRNYLADKPMSKLEKLMRKRHLELTKTALHIVASNMIWGK